MPTRTVRDLVGSSTYQRVGRALSDSFPDQRARIRDHHVDAMIVHMWETLSDAELGALLLPRPSAAEVALQKAKLFQQDGDPVDQGLSYYEVSSEHHRLYTPGDHFIGRLPMGRISLPLTDSLAFKRKTQVGWYFPNDHLYSSVEQLAWEYKEELGAVRAAEVTRVDVVTPMRSAGTRFGAISVFLGYREGDDAPSFYLLEAGFATGEAGVPFLSPDMRPIPPTRSGYVPTPFSSSRNYYNGNLVMDGHHPLRLTVEVRNQTWVPPHLRITVNFEHTLAPTPVWPGWLILEAAGRVGLIGEAVGQPGFERVFAGIGRLAPWIKKPAQ